MDEFQQAINDRRKGDPELIALRGDVHSIRASMEKLADAVTQLAVLEQKHSTLASAQERAFTELSKLKDRQEDHEVADEKFHGQVSQRIAFVLGAAAAVSVGWSVFGWYLTDSVKEIMKTQEQFRTHLAIDRVTSADDVKTIQKSAGGK